MLTYMFLAIGGDLLSADNLSKAKKTMCVVNVTRPTLNFLPPTLNFFSPNSEVGREHPVPMGRTIIHSGVWKLSVNSPVIFLSVKA